MVEELQKDPSKLKLGGQRKEMTFLFMDICGFTPVSEHYKNKNDPEGLVELINKYLDTMTKIILSHGGTIDKYMGTASWRFGMRLLIVKTTQTKLVYAAKKYRRKQMNLLKSMKNKVFLALMLVSASAQASVLSETWAQNLDLTIQSSEMPSTWARLEGQTRNYPGTRVLLSARTVGLGKDHSYTRVDDIKVKGKEERVVIYTC